MNTEKVAEKAQVVAKKQEVKEVKEVPAENNEPMVEQELPNDEGENRPQFVKTEKEDKLGKIARKLKENPAVKNIPTHVLELACIVKDNAEIRRFTSLAILNYLHQKNELHGKKGYVDFLWNKFAVKAGGLSREYRYTEPFFIKALVSAFTSFANSANKTINNFLEIELNTEISEVTNNKEIAEIVETVATKEE